MLIHFDISMAPQLSEACGRKKFDIEFDGNTLQDFIEHIISRFGKKAKDAIMDENGKIDPILKVILNSEQYIVPERFSSTKLKNGDRIKIMVFVAGG